MKTFNYFTITRETTPEVLKKQYFNLAQKYHPDSPSQYASKEKFQEMNAEYQEALKQLKEHSENTGREEQTSEFETLISHLAKLDVRNDILAPMLKAGFQAGIKAGIAGFMRFINNAVNQ